MMVPTLTRFGLLAGVRGTGAVSVTDAVATMAIITTPRRGSAPDPLLSPGGTTSRMGGPPPIPPAPVPPDVPLSGPDGKGRHRIGAAQQDRASCYAQAPADQ
jgi:hypothetical protein